MEEDIIHRAARIFGVDPDAIPGRSRLNAIVRARFAIAHVLRRRQLEARRPSLREIGIILGGRDHSTIREALITADELLRIDAGFREDVASLLGEHPDPPEPEPRHPPVLTRRCKVKNEPAAGDSDAVKRMRATDSLLAAIRREHPERIAA